MTRLQQTKCRQGEREWDTLPVMLRDIWNEHKSWISGTESIYFSPRITFNIVHNCILAAGLLSFVRMLRAHLWNSNNWFNKKRKENRKPSSIILRESHSIGSIQFLEISHICCNCTSFSLWQFKKKKEIKKTLNFAVIQIFYLAQTSCKVKLQR